MANTAKRALRAQKQKTSRILMTVFLAILSVCLIGQIYMIVQTTNQSREMRSVEYEIRQLDARADNLNLLLGQLGDSDQIRVLAQNLGMVEPRADQIRVVNLPDALAESTVQSAENTGAESVNQ